MANLWRKLLGTVDAELRGPEPEKLLERFRIEGISLWSVQSMDKCSTRISFWQRDRELLETLAREHGYELEILRLSGGSRGRESLKRRKGLLLGLALAAVLLGASSLFVWQVQVVGCEKSSTGEVLRALASCGVEPGSFRPSIDTELVKSRVLTQLPKLEWLTVNISGSRARVLVQEREERPELLAENKTKELRASRPGVVRKLFVLSGRPLVEEGDAVLTGDLLISGELESIAGEARQELALGEVQAETWYEISAVCPADMLALQEKENGKHGFSLQIGKKRLNFWPSSGKGLDECDKIVHEYTLGIPGLFSTPIRLVHTLRHIRTQTDRIAQREEEMKAALLQGLEERIEGEVLEHDFSVSRSENLLVLTLRAHCLENIARDWEE